MNEYPAAQEFKTDAARAALGFLQNGMLIGLGSGSTASLFIELLGEALQTGQLRDVRAVPTSDKTATQAVKLGIPIVSLTQAGELDLAVDGADEVDPALNLIKGLGRALLREKIVETHARRFIVIVDESKLVNNLGSRVPLPVEIIKFEPQVQIRWLSTFGCLAEQWFEENGAPVVTENGNYLARCWFSPAIPDSYKLAEELNTRPGIVEHGLFLLHPTSSLPG
jgi:ribose 5-phosphate isomerase A